MLTLYLDPQLRQLRLADGCRRVHHQVDGLGGLGERDDLAQALGAGQEHGNAVQAQSDASMWRRAVLQRLQEEAEARPGFFFTHAQSVKDLLLNVLAVNTDRS